MSDKPPTSPVTIAGVSFTITLPFLSGHVCSAGEARVLNIARTDAIRNSFARRVKEVLGSRTEGLSLAENERLQAELAVLDANYSFRPDEPLRSADPVQAEALRIAKSKVEEALQKRGVKLESLSSEQLASKIVQVSTLDAIQQEAKSRVEAIKSAADWVLEEGTAEGTPE